MIREIENIFLDFPGYGCFACDPRNTHGLRLRFFADDEKGDVYTRTTPERHLQGFPGILHGGIQCALVDEVAFWTMFDRHKKIALTTNIEMEFLRPVGTASEIEVRGRIVLEDGRRISVEVVIYDQEKVCTRSRVDYIIPKKEVTMKVMGKERFTGKFTKYLDD
ncbi:MAG TPA: PaaI family thioesterase [Thermodesulfobacteriota bacterium]|nr:PaaI family thioesterase [Thermodesulfobacteriota bacterium]